MGQAITEQGNGVGNVSGTVSGAKGLITTQMQDLASVRATYAGLDHATVWVPLNQDGQASAFYLQLYALSRVLAVARAPATPAKRPIQA